MRERGEEGGELGEEEDGKRGKGEVKWNDRNENETQTSSLHASAVRLWLLFLFLFLLETFFLFSFLPFSCYLRS